MVKFNMIGFNFSNPSNYSGYDEYRHCAIHKGSRLIKDEKEPDLLFCPQCGCRYPVKDTVTKQNIQSKINPNSGTKIITGKTKRKFYDSFANLIPQDDKETLQDLAAGRKIVYYHSSVDEPE